MYDKLDDNLRRYVDALTTHARTALWPERWAALESFRRGIVRSNTDEIKAALAAVPIDLPPYLQGGEALFRLVLTAYLERLGDDQINNPDQADIYAKSLDAHHNRLARAWFDARRPDPITP